MSSSTLADPTPEATRKRTKWEPAMLMAIVLGLGFWIAFGPASKPRFPTAPGAITMEVRLGNTRGELEAFKPQGASDYSFRLWMVRGPANPTVMSRTEAENLWGKDNLDELVSAQHNWLFRTFSFLKITSLVSLVWVGIGFLGQLAFSGRMVLQWLASERHRRSVITESFWWFSLFGGVTLFSYFVWRQDPIGILGQASGIVIYARNIRLLRKHARRAARDGVRPE
jgi:lipid-A-disaccharide synthase-like uncharacterized protein